jgi:hypothetical protein
MKRLILLIPIFMLVSCSTTKVTVQQYQDPFDPDLFTNILNEEIYKFHEEVDSLNNQNFYYISNK